MKHNDIRHINAERRRDPQAYAADEHERSTAAADDTLWHIVHGGDLPAMENLLTLYFDNYTTAASVVLNQVLIDALSQVKELDDTAAGALWDRLVGIIKETQE
jgi:hypothetical protein